MSFRDIAGLLFPPEHDATDLIKAENQFDQDKIKKIGREQWWWRMKVSAMLAAGGALFIWSFTPVGFVRAGEVSKVIDTKVSEAIKELKAEQVNVSQKLKAIDDRGTKQDDLLKEILRGQLSSSICRIIVRQKAERDVHEKSRLRLDADTEQEKYRVIIGEYYPESRCGS